MKFKVTGSNRDTGARMTLEFEADSKAAAERKASQSGMNVNRVENITDGYDTQSTTSTTRRSRGSRPGFFIRFLILVALIAAAIWWFFLRGRGLQLPINLK
jgi:hypothetical protein